MCSGLGISTRMMVLFDPHFQCYPGLVHVTAGRCFAACVHEIQSEVRSVRQREEASIPRSVFLIS